MYKAIPLFLTLGLALGSLGLPLQPPSLTAFEPEEGGSPPPGSDRRSAIENPVNSTPLFA